MKSHRFTIVLLLFITSAAGTAPDFYRLSEATRRIGTSVATNLDKMCTALEENQPQLFEDYYHSNQQLMAQLNPELLSWSDRRFLFCMKRAQGLAMLLAARLFGKGLPSSDRINKENQLSDDQLRMVMVRCTAALEAMVRSGESRDTWNCDPGRIDPPPNQRIR